MSTKINNRLKGFRTMARYTQEDMANILGISRIMYNYKENGSSLFNKEQKNEIFSELKKKLPELKMEDVFPIE